MTCVCGDVTVDPDLLEIGDLVFIGKCFDVVVVLFPLITFSSWIVCCLDLYEERRGSAALQMGNKAFQQSDLRGLLLFPDRSTRTPICLASSSN